MARQGDRDVRLQLELVIAIGVNSYLELPQKFRMQETRNRINKFPRDQSAPLLFLPVINSNWGAIIKIFSYFC